ncbi:MAG: type I-E CRISPR-associated protein Cas7/Cse4/CasC [Dermatophilus congolensis]|nr:type I-E CRISPR-associated protein Cas7/Cse4/CasC [Dermatophilus congolensis]
MPTFIDFHIIQTLPPSNINRDDTGAPKTAVYGGVQRARVSSQAWKRATRRDFDDLVDVSRLSRRTKRLVELIGNRILARRGSAVDDAGALTAAYARAEEVIKALGMKVEKPRKKADEGAPEPAGQSEYLLFISATQADRLADLAAGDGALDKKAVKEVMKGGNGIDLALFGRMVANDADINVDAAVQVAHALSTHAADIEDDYYTAVDDENPAADTGAGMIGTVEFSSSTLYRFASINVAGLAANLENAEAAGEAAAAFTRAFVTSMPTGKQNAFGNRTLPDGVVVMVRDMQPVSLVGAFEEAVPPGPQGFVRASCEQLAAHAKAQGEFVAAPQATWVTRGGPAASALDALGERMTLDELVDRVRTVTAEKAGD